MNNRGELLWLSVVALFLELAIIRWLSTEIRIFAYFKNLPLLAAFLGFGIGFYYYREADRLFYKWLPRLLTLLVCVIALSPLLSLTRVIFVDPRQYFLLGAGFGDHVDASAPSFLAVTKAYVVVVGIFGLVVATFAALTSRLGELLNLEPPLSGYSLNVLGSLLGVTGFALASHLESPPLAWIAFVYSALLVLYWRHLSRHRVDFRQAAFYFFFSTVIVGRMGWIIDAAWSPYYQILIDSSDSSNIGVMVNYDGFQVIQDLSREHVESFDEDTKRKLNRHYNIPYSLSTRQVESVLILGGGTGNDAAAALRNGAGHVDVVEIDPVIARLGRKLHPEHPYSSDKVSLHIDDARSYLQTTKNKYDLVVFATLDSHAAFSSLSSIRMDNFIFTEESVAKVKSLLKPGGGIAINFFAIKDWLSERHATVLKDVMGQAPLAFASPVNQEVILLSGQLFDAGRDLGLTDYMPVRLPFTVKPVEPTTDNWPFLFLEERGIPFHYIAPLLLICIVSVIPWRYGQLKAGNVNWQFFFLGASFLLIESKAVTALGLLFGSTWLVNSIVIGSVLAMILVANLFTASGQSPSFLTLYLALSAFLIANFIFPLDRLNAIPWGARLIIAGAILAAPLAVASVIFAKAFMFVKQPSLALASNLFGTLVGGVLEYSDMWTGLRFLNLIALGLYLLSYVFLTRNPLMSQATSNRIES